MATNSKVSVRGSLAQWALVALAVLAPLQAAAQQAFPSPDAAAESLFEAVATSNPEGLRAVLGADWKRYIPPETIDAQDEAAFLAAWAEKHEIVRDSEDRAHLAVGPDGWTLPIPIVSAGGAWHFDTRAGAQQMRIRRIGRNELSAMQAALAYYDAQQEYAQTDPEGGDVPAYAQRIISTPGKKDGLYWAALPGEEESPLGPLFGDDKPGSDYHGYRYRILKAQGPHAPGGAYDYRIGGRMTSGFALVAWPVRYGESGVMTFMVSHAGRIYEKDLGPDTGAAARAITRFDPDSSWTEVSP